MTWELVWQLVVLMLAATLCGIALVGAWRK